MMVDSRIQKSSVAHRGAKKNEVRPSRAAPGGGDSANKMVAQVKRRVVDPVV